VDLIPRRPDLMPMIHSSHVLDLVGSMAMATLSEWMLPCSIAIGLLVVIGYIFLVLHRKEQAERRKRRAEAVERRVGSKLAELLPSFDQTTPGLFNLAGQLGIEHPDSTETLLELDRRLTRDPVVLGSLARLNKMVNSCAAFREQTDAIQKFIYLEVTHRSNEVQRPIGAPERGQHRLTVRKQLELLMPLEKEFKSEREEFRMQVRQLLTDTVCEIALHHSWQEPFSSKWSALLRHARFETIGLKAIRAARANALGWSP
jgi:hypothetical protein